MAASGRRLQAGWTAVVAWLQEHRYPPRGRMGLRTVGARAHRRSARAAGSAADRWLGGAGACRRDPTALLPYWPITLRIPRLLRSWRPEAPTIVSPTTPDLDTGALLRLAATYEDGHPAARVCERSRNSVTATAWTAAHSRASRKPRGAACTPPARPSRPRSSSAPVMSAAPSLLTRKIDSGSSGFPLSRSLIRNATSRTSAPASSPIVRPEP